MTGAQVMDRVLAEVERATDELVAFAAELIRIPTVNPPGEAYTECAQVLGEHLTGWGHRVEYIDAEGRPEHTALYPRTNVVGTKSGSRGGRSTHLNGHFDVVPAGDGWSVDPFGGVVRDGRLYGRGSADMKAGLACAAMAVEAISRSGVELAGDVEISGTVDEESGGYAGVAHLAKIGRITKGRTDYVIIPEPFGPDAVCVGHRGVYWFRVTTRGRTAHGSMPFLGRNAVDAMAALLERVRTGLQPSLADRRTAMPVVPAAARSPTINVNSITGGQVGADLQSPCVPDTCSAVFDRRFLPEESLESVRAELLGLIDSVAGTTEGVTFDVDDIMVVHPTLAPGDSPLIHALRTNIRLVRGAEGALVASPGTYDQKHVAALAGIPHCVAYGPGQLEQAHQPDEWCAIDDMVAATQVLALTVMDLAGVVR